MPNDTHSDHISHDKEIHKKHTWIMLICCLLPLLGIIVLSILGIIGSWSFFAVMILLCPVLHLFVMGAMRRKDKKDK